MRELVPEVAEAREALLPLARAAREAQAKADAAERRLVELEGALQAARERSKRHEQLLQRIEDEGPRPLS